LIDEGFDEARNDIQDMDEGDALLEASVGDALEDAVMQDFSDVVARGSPVNEENVVAKMEEDVEIDATRGRDKSVSEPEFNQAPGRDATEVVKMERELFDVMEEQDVEEVPAVVEAPQGGVGVITNPMPVLIQVPVKLEQLDVEEIHAVDEAPQGGEKVISKPMPVTKKAPERNSEDEKIKEVVNSEDPEVVEVPVVKEAPQVLFKQPRIPDPTYGRRVTNPKPVSNQAPGRNPDGSTPPTGRTLSLRRSQSVREIRSRERQHHNQRGWPTHLDFYPPLASIDMNTSHGGYGSKRSRYDGNPGSSGYYTCPQPILPRRSRSLTPIPRMSSTSNYSNTNMQRPPTLPLVSIGVSAVSVPGTASVSASAPVSAAAPPVVAAAPPVVAAALPVVAAAPVPPPAPVTPPAIASPVLPGKMTPPIQATPPGPGATLPSPMVYEEVPEPLFALVSCKGFSLEDRLALRSFLYIGGGDKIAKDPNDSNLLVVQKGFHDPTKAEHFKMGYDKACYGEPPEKVMVKLLAKPPIALGEAGNPTEHKRPVGRPPKKA